MEIINGVEYPIVFDDTDMKELMKLPKNWRDNLPEEPDWVKEEIRKITEEPD
jgi:hypothetical protein